MTYLAIKESPRRKIDLYSPKTNITSDIIVDVSKNMITSNFFFSWKNSSFITIAFVI